MQILRRFTVADLVATAEANKDNAQRFARGLIAHGYLRIDRPKQNGLKGGHTIFALARDTGPNPPRLCKDGTIYDPNLAETRSMGAGQ